MGGSLWERRPTFIENSPLYHLDKVRAPVLLIHSTTDWSSPVHLADETFVALRRLGQRVAYAKYVGEEHEDMFWRYSDARDMLRRILSWVDEYVVTSAPGSVVPPPR
jgi:dipeptidyl aminopeptidase/acylaminoacyl peptidase